MILAKLDTTPSVARVLIEVVAVLLIVVGFLLGVIALFGMRTHGKSGILAPAIVGIIINGLFLFLIVPGLLSAIARAQQQRGDVPPSIIQTR